MILENFSYDFVGILNIFDVLVVKFLFNQLVFLGISLINIIFAINQLVDALTIFTILWKIIEELRQLTKRFNFFEPQRPDMLLLLALVGLHDWKSNMKYIINALLLLELLEDWELNAWVELLRLRCGDAFTISCFNSNFKFQELCVRRGLDRCQCHLFVLWLDKENILIYLSKTLLEFMPDLSQLLVGALFKNEILREEVQSRILVERGFFLEWILESLIQFILNELCALNIFPNFNCQQIWREWSLLARKILNGL